MIELVSESRCTECDICVKVCPTNVFDAVPDAPPVIARQEDCQTCFMCEANCPVDALYVSPYAERSESVDESDLIERGFLGGYREDIGWGHGRVSVAARTEPLLLRQAFQSRLRVRAAYDERKDS